MIFQQSVPAAPIDLKWKESHSTSIDVSWNQKSGLTYLVRAELSCNENKNDCKGGKDAGSTSHVSRSN